MRKILDWCSASYLAHWQIPGGNFRGNTGGWVGLRESVTSFSMEITEIILTIMLCLLAIMLYFFALVYNYPAL